MKPAMVWNQPEALADLVCIYRTEHRQTPEMADRVCIHRTEHLQSPEKGTHAPADTQLNIYSSMMHAGSNQKPNLLTNVTKWFPIIFTQ